jgi:hypothetical protein
MEMAEIAEDSVRCVVFSTEAAADAVIGHLRYARDGLPPGAVKP